MKPIDVRPSLDEWGWQARAACRGMAASVFFSPPNERGINRHRREQRAQTICEGCPVRHHCAAFAIRTAQDFGVWGGLTETDRRDASDTHSHGEIRAVLDGDWRPTILYLREDLGRGRPVVLVHGWPLHLAVWERQVRALIEAGHRVIAHDRRGYGKSSRTWLGHDPASAKRF